MGLPRRTLPNNASLRRSCTLFVLLDAWGWVESGVELGDERAQLMRQLMTCVLHGAAMTCVSDAAAHRTRSRRRTRGA